MTNERLLTNAFQMCGGHPVLDFVNTLDNRFRKSEAEELLLTYEDLLRFARQAGIMSAEDATQLLQSAGKRAGATVLGCAVELREAIAEVLYAGLEKRGPAPARLRTLERYFQEARAHQKLVWNGSRAVWDVEVIGTGPQLPLRLLSLAASNLLTSEAANAVRECGNPECRWLFLDSSKNHTRRWCDMKLCGNRMKARRFKAHHDT